MGAFLEDLLGWGRALVGGSTGHVNLGGRGLEAVPGWVSLYRDATGLSLDGNRLRALPPSLGVLRSLASLDIANNPFG
jgi:Leucine-rich repeat (LRR) protein